MVPRTLRRFLPLVRLHAIIRLHQDLPVEGQLQRYETTIASTPTPSDVIRQTLPLTRQQQDTLSPVTPLPKVNPPQTRPISLQ